MSPTWITLIYLICAIMNILQIHEISKQYFQYETTSNVEIEIQQVIDFPSFTLCVDIPATLKWNKVSPGRLNLAELFLRGRPSSIQSMPTRPDFYDDLMSILYDEIAEKMTIPEILNMTYGIENIFYLLTPSGVFLNSNRSTNFDRLMSNLSNFQFSIDKTFLHAGLKCFTLSLRSGLYNKIDLNDLVESTEGGDHLLFWEVNFLIHVRFFLHKKNYLISQMDDYYESDFGYITFVQFETFESIRLGYPYQTNCRDYTKVGLSSRKECIEGCFKNKTVTKFGHVFFRSHAFYFDNFFLGVKEDPGDTQHIIQECKLQCKEIECHSTTYNYYETISKKLTDFLGQTCSISAGATCSKNQWDFEKTSAVIINPPILPISRTESQSALPLVTFLTTVFSTFGFWLGLSVSDFFHVAPKIWQKVEIARDKIRSRVRLAQRSAFHRRILNTFIRLQQVHFLSRRRQQRINPGI